MTLNEYIINCFIDEKNIIEELLMIDNRIMHEDMSYIKLFTTIKSIEEKEIEIDKVYSLITDGEIKTVYYALINYYKNIKKIYVSRKYLFFYKWLVSKVNEYTNQMIELDISEDYMGYFSPILLSGYKEYKEQVIMDLADKEIMEI